MMLQVGCGPGYYQALAHPPIRQGVTNFGKVGFLHVGFRRWADALVTLRELVA